MSDLKNDFEESKDLFSGYIKNAKKIDGAKDVLISLYECQLYTANNKLCDILKEYCGGMEDNPEYYETERTSEAVSVMFLEKQGFVEVIEGRFPETRYIKFRFLEPEEINTSGRVKDVDDTFDQFQDEFIRSLQE